MIAILSTLAPLFLITAIGYALAALKFGGNEMWHALDHITFYVFFPALLIKTLMRADLGSVPARDFVFVSFGSVTIMSGALLAAYLLLKRPVSGVHEFFPGRGPVPKHHHGCHSCSLVWGEGPDALDGRPVGASSHRRRYRGSGADRGNGVYHSQKDGGRCRTDGADHHLSEHCVNSDPSSFHLAGTKLIRMFFDRHRGSTGAAAEGSHGDE